MVCRQSRNRQRSPAFAYSLGLFQNFGQPEIILFGLDLDTMHTLINNVGDLARKGARFLPGDSSDELLEAYTCAFRPVSRAQLRDHMTYTQWFYGDDEVPAVQLVWPDRNGNLPWDEGFDERYRAGQPDLSR
jgi:Domain of unknown function (DUF4262)